LSFERIFNNKCVKKKMIYFYLLVILEHRDTEMLQVRALCKKTAMSNKE